MNSRADRDRQHARDCAEMARSTNDPHIRRSCLELEKQWLALAKKAEERRQSPFQIFGPGRYGLMPKRERRA